MPVLTRSTARKLDSIVNTYNDKKSTCDINTLVVKLNEWTFDDFCKHCVAIFKLNYMENAPYRYVTQVRVEFDLKTRHIIELNHNIYDDDDDDDNDDDDAYKTKGYKYSSVRDYEANYFRKSGLVGLFHLYINYYINIEKYRTDEASIAHWNSELGDDYLTMLNFALKYMPNKTYYLLLKKLPYIIMLTYCNNSERTPSVLFKLAKNNNKPAYKYILRYVDDTKLMTWKERYNNRLVLNPSRV
jgi:hypothetical protein